MLFHVSFVLLVDQLHFLLNSVYSDFPQVINKRAALYFVFIYDIFVDLAFNIDFFDFLV